MEHLRFNLPDPGDERAADRLRFADLTEWYPKPQNPSPNGAGAPSAPASSGAVSAVGSPHKSPALWTLAFVGVGLVLLHHNG